MAPLTNTEAYDNFFALKKMFDIGGPFRRNEYVNKNYYTKVLMSLGSAVFFASLLIAMVYFTSQFSIENFGERNEDVVDGFKVIVFLGIMFMAAIIVVGVVLNNNTHRKLRDTYNELRIGEAIPILQTASDWERNSHFLTTQTRAFLPMTLADLNI